MREILFRIWDSKNQAMVYPSVIGVGAENFAWCHSLDWIHDCQDWSEKEGYFENPELMQYTGLKDKDGNKIFEGDIVVYDDTPYNAYGVRILGVIKFEKSRWVIKYKSRYGSSYPLEADDFSEKKNQKLGNIHENPELLEESN